MIIEIIIFGLIALGIVLTWYGMGKYGVERPWGKELCSDRRFKWKVHELKCWSGPFNEILSGQKRFEYRLNDRDYEVGDELVLREWNIDTEYTGRKVRRKVTSILKTGFGLPEGYCIMSIGDGND